MLFTIKDLEFINGVSKTTDKPYHMVAVTTAERPDEKATGFASSETDTWNIGDKIDIVIKPDGEYNGTPKFKFAVVDSSDGRVYKIYEYMKSMSMDVAAIKLALNIADAPVVEKKPRAHKTDDQKAKEEVVSAKVAKDLDDISTEDLPF